MESQPQILNSGLILKTFAHAQANSEGSIKTVQSPSLARAFTICFSATQSKGFNLNLGYNYPLSV